MHSWFPGEHSFAKDFHHVKFFLHPSLKVESQLIFQDGPVEDYGPNGVTNEEVIEALIERLTALNQDPFGCYENDMAISCLKESILWLNQRTQKTKGSRRQRN